MNLRGVFLGCREAARQMIAQGSGGRIVNAPSGAGRRGDAPIGAYAASKFGVIGLTQALAVELAPHRITVNAYCPGHVTSTPMWDFIDSESARLGGGELRAAKRAAKRPPRPSPRFSARAPRCRSPPQSPTSPPTRRDS